MEWDFSQNTQPLSVPASSPLQLNGRGREGGEGRREGGKETEGEGRKERRQAGGSKWEGFSGATSSERPTLVWRPYTTGHRPAT